MAKIRTIYNETGNREVLKKGKWCVSFWCHLHGLMFRRRLPADAGLVFVRNRPSRVDTAIHMLFCFFAIGVVWLDADLKVVDKKLAKPWRPLYIPQEAAQYYIEALPLILERVQIGDRLSFKDFS